MKDLKILGLAAIAALALAAFGASSASATVLCSNNTNPCVGTKYGFGTKLTMALKSGTVSTLTSAFGNVKCTGSTVEGEVTMPAARPRQLQA